MAKNLNKVRRQIESRRRVIDDTVRRREKTFMTSPKHDDFGHESVDVVSSERPNETQSSTNMVHFFIFRCLVAGLLFLLIGIAFQSKLPQSERVEYFVRHTFENEFQFAAIASWYENQFGRPLALLPIDANVAQGDPDEEVEFVYALPASGTIREDFDESGQGILIETDVHARIESVKSGVVRSIGQTEDSSIEKAVVIEHYDGTEAIYGMLDGIEVQLYDHVQSGTKIGTAQSIDGAEKGIFYFALKNENGYIDPSEVLTFD
ncbi:M23 family metallopeptidase [Halalkalibacter hemicellulosilyticus]|uniref:Stage IV sporulation protein FA n=1 Tax=Halalkalibacter hemicellulosilyticusJCM 9152 TaxID=1236971 RepID=W4QIH9_9BACI|nr:M23 family metallopeptidase [Halalkalibacter hemicellulosilyticus]GAE31154.1 stage IV sporulation protein FA [Halalkalibacter hemicellulosilyticusJCM 9152]